MFILLGHALEGGLCGSSLSGQPACHVCGRWAPGRGRVSQAVCPACNQATGLGLSFLEASGRASTLLLANGAAERVRPRRQGSSRGCTRRGAAREHVTGSHSGLTAVGLRLRGGSQPRACPSAVRPRRDALPGAHSPGPGDPQASGASAAAPFFLSRAFGLIAWANAPGRLCLKDRDAGFCIFSPYPQPGAGRSVGQGTGLAQGRRKVTRG